MTPRRALLWTAIWVSFALCFCSLIYLKIGPEFLQPHLGPDKAKEFLSGYLIEYALSVDNLFVFLMLFGHFKVPPRLQRRVLTWGIVSVIFLRGVMILVGAALIQRFHFVLVGFGLLLLYTAWKMLAHGEEEQDAESLTRNPILKLFRKVMPVSTTPDGEKFFTRRSGFWEATPLLVILLLVEVTDILFAVDSIPAIFAITTDTFIVFSSNLLAVMGLRSLYFLLARVEQVFKYVKKGVGIILAFVGVKMIVGPLGLHIPVDVSLAVVVSILVGSALLSFLKRDPSVKFLSEDAGISDEDEQP